MCGRLAGMGTPGGAAPFDAVVLAGGSSSRLGTDKTRVLIDGVAVLDRVLAAVSGARRRIVVGEARPVASPVQWTREQPPGSGPAAGVVAGLQLVRASRVVLLASDSPYVTTGTVARLLAGLDGRRAVTLVDRSGRRQHLIAAAETAALRAAAASRPHWADAAMHELMAPLDASTVPAEGDEAVDIDTPRQLATAAKGQATMRTWLADVQVELGIDVGIDQRLLLDVAREVAHGVDRPAAPLTTFLIGYAAAQRGGGADAVAGAAAEVSALATGWTAERG